MDNLESQFSENEIQTLEVLENEKIESLNVISEDLNYENINSGKLKNPTLENEMGNMESSENGNTESEVSENDIENGDSESENIAIDYSENVKLENDKSKSFTTENEKREMPENESIESNITKKDFLNMEYQKMESENINIERSDLGNLTNKTIKNEFVKNQNSESNITMNDNEKSEILVNEMKSRAINNSSLNEESNVEETSTKTNYALNEKIDKINILLLGETGVGKSTWINGFVNYLTYGSLNEAKNGEEVSLIASKFTVTDDKFKQHLITYGGDNDNNEATQTTTQSNTQMPKTYSFDLQNINIRIIDTPGIGDTRGIEQDKVNMQNIMDHLSHYDELNGIVVLLKPNNARLNLMFSFCIKELLTHLHKDACKNILICFTNSRSTFYRPGDTMPALQELLGSLSIDVKLTQDTVYCMDNESVRFLMAVKTIKFGEREQNDYEASWKKSVDESMRLICYISHLPSHSIQKTLSINKVRRSIIEQSRPMALIAKAIQTNIHAISEKKKEALSVNSTKAELHKKLQVPTVRLKKIALSFPRTVCTDPKCISIYSDDSNDKSQILYKTICHPHCHINTNENTIRCVELQNCDAMDKSLGKCKICSCPWETHMHITYDMKEETVWIEDETTKRLINLKDGAIRAIEEHQKKLDDKLKDLKFAKKRIAEVNAVFACFLKHNAIAPYNDALLDYLNHLIENEKMKIAVGISSKTVKGLGDLKSVYEQEIQIIEEAIGRKTYAVQNLDVKKINELILELKTLPIAGSMLEGVMKEVHEVNEKATKLNEKVIKLPKDKIQKISDVGQRAREMNDPEFKENKSNGFSIKSTLFKVGSKLKGLFSRDKTDLK